MRIQEIATFIDESETAMILALQKRLKQKQSVIAFLGARQWVPSDSGFQWRIDFPPAAMAAGGFRVPRHVT